MKTQITENMETKTKSDFEFIKGVKEYIVFEEVVRFKYKGKLYERVLLSNIRRNEGDLYLRDEDGNVKYDGDLLDKCEKWYHNDKSVYKRIEKIY